MKRVAIFIDGLNVRNRLRECKWDEFYDVGAFTSELVGPRTLTNAYFYHPQPNVEQLGTVRYAAERAYLHKVQSDPTVIAPTEPYMAKRQRIVKGVPIDYWVEKMTDVLLASDLVYFAATGAIDVAVLVTADADIVPAVRRCVVDFKIPVELVRFRGARPRLYNLEKTATSFRRARPLYFQPYP